VEEEGWVEILSRPAAPARAVAVKRTGNTGEASIRAVREYWTLAVVPNVQLTWAIPCSFVVAVSGETAAFRLGVNDTGTPETPFPAASFTRTEGPGLTGEPTVAS
jgi:hypothetical protein